MNGLKIIPLYLLAVAKESPLSCKSEIDLEDLSVAIDAKERTHERN